MSTLSPITATTTVVQSQDLITNPLGDETVMMSLEKGNYYSVDHIGTHIWQRIKEPITVSALCQSLTDVFDVSLDQCQADVLNFLNQMYEEGVVRIVTANDG